MSEMLVLEHKKVDNGKMILAYLTASFSPKTQRYSDNNVVYQCYMPDAGRVEKVPEMSKYFFFDKLEKLFPQAILLTSEDCMALVSDRAEDVFTINGHRFIKTYTTAGMQYIENKKR